MALPIPPKFKLPNLKDQKTRLKFLLYGGAVASVVIFFVAIGLPLTSHPVFCGQLCHSMRREYQTWKRSSHANITCTACHVNQGLVAFGIEKGIDGPKGMFKEITVSYDKPINAESELGFSGKIPAATCERCHNMVYRNVTPSRIFSVKMFGSGKDKYHYKHLKKGMPCTLCHNRITHKDIDKPEILKAAGYNDPKDPMVTRDYENGLSMAEGCFRCHAPAKEERNEEIVKKYNSQKAPKDCLTCHNADILPIGHKDNNWRTIHPGYAKKNFNYCFNCHAANARFNFEGEPYCTRCHAASLVDSWLKK